MARKIFVSYKHDDINVAPINGKTTARAYVDELINLFEGGEIYKGEGDEDLSKFKNETVMTHLKEKIYDSSITIVLISPNIKTSKKESDQWIPWEISYSLKEVTRDGRTSKSNAVLAIVLPNFSLSYNYFVQENICTKCKAVRWNTSRIFKIIKANMFNKKNPDVITCPNHSFNETIYGSSVSYIHKVKWCDFLKDKEGQLKIAEERRENIKDYNITKEVSD